MSKATSKSIASRWLALSLVFPLATGAQQLQPADTARAPFSPAGLGRAAWTWTGGSENTDWITRVIVAKDGSIVAVGFVNRIDGGSTTPEWDAVAMRFAPDGRLIWNRRYGGAGLDAFWDVKETRDGLAFTGFSVSSGAGGNDAWLVLADSSGNTRSEHRYGGSGDDRGTALVSAANGDLLIVGETEGDSTRGRDVFIVRVDSTGNEKWRRAHGGTGVDRAFYALPVSGGIVLAGVTGAVGAYDILTMKVDDSGEIVWRQVAGAEGNDANHGMNVLPDGRIMVGGYSQSWGATVHDVVALTYSPDGELLRQEMIGMPGDDRVMGTATDSAGGTWFTGYTRSDGSGGWDIMMARARPDGSFEPWLGAIGTAFDDNAYTIATASNGDLIIGGYTNAPGGAGSRSDLLVMRIDPREITRKTDGVVVRRIK